MGRVKADEPEPGPFLCLTRLRLRRLALTLAAALLAGPVAADTLVGVAAPLSGRFAGQGLAIRNSIERAAEAANAGGGLAGGKIGVVALDDGCDARGGGESARRLVEQKVAVVIGHVCASAALAAAPVYAQAGTILLSLTRHPDLTDKRAGPTTYRVAGRDDRQGDAIARYLISTHPNSRIALVHDRTRYGKGLIEGAQRALAAAGIAPVLIDNLVAGEKDYPDLVARLRAAEAGWLVYGGFGSELAIIEQGIRAAGARIRLAAGDAIAAEANSGALNDAVFLQPSSPLDLAALAAAAFSMWQQAAGASDGRDTQAIAAALARAAGFDAQGDLQQAAFRIYRAVAGKAGPAE